MIQVKETSAGPITFGGAGPASSGYTQNNYSQGSGYQQGNGYGQTGSMQSQGYPQQGQGFQQGYPQQGQSFQQGYPQQSMGNQPQAGSVQSQAGGILGTVMNTLGISIGVPGQQNSGYPNQNQGYNQQNQNQGYNQQNQGYQFNQQNSGYPQQNQGYQQNSGYNQSSPIQQEAKQRKLGGGVTLKKGTKTNLSSANTLKRVNVCLGWDFRPGLNAFPDLDVAAFMLGPDKKCLGDDWIVFYGNPSSPDKSVLHGGDGDGSASGDDEIISLDLDRVSPQVSEIVFVITIEDCLKNGYNFGLVSNAYIRVVDTLSMQEKFIFPLDDLKPEINSLMALSLYRYQDTWKMNPIGNGIVSDLKGVCEFYGLTVVE